MIYRISVIFLILLCTETFTLYAQDSKIKISIYDGAAIIGYVDDGGFLNFTGPNINLVLKNSKFIFGMLPSLRFKHETVIPKSAFITPTLGVGFTYSYKLLAFQIPLYYNAKTATENGRWRIGFGLGLRINGL